MKTNYQMLRDLLEKYHPEQRGVMSRAENVLIKETLHIDEMDILQLRNLRDFTVEYMGKYKKMDDWDRMSAVTYAIDLRIVELGGEV